MSDIRKEAGAESIDKPEPAGVSRRGLLRASTMAAGAAALFASTIVSEQAAAGAMTQKASGYQTTPKDGQQCDGCALFIAPGSCKIVAGDISPQGWCRFYAKKS